MKYIDVLKALADFNRLAIMCYLRNGEKCACEIEQVLPISQSATSKHPVMLSVCNFCNKTKQWLDFHENG